MGSRVRIAAAACLVASGLVTGGVGAALAVADPASQVDDDGTKSTDGADDHGGRTPPATRDDADRPAKDDKPGNTTPDDEQRSDEGEVDPDDEKPDDEKPDDEKPVDAEPGDDKVPPADTTHPTKPADPPEPSKSPEPSPTPEPPETPTVVEDPPAQYGCEDGNDDDCGPPRPPWWPWPLPWDPDWEGPGEPPSPGGGGIGGGGGGPQPPAGRPELPGIQLPPHVGVEPDNPAVISAVPGLGVAAAALPLAPITLPVIVAPPLTLGGAGAGPPSAPRVTVPEAPRVTPAEPPAGRQPPPGAVGSNATIPPASYRVGYTDYLRSAGVSQLVTLAAPGVAGMLVLTGAGGLVGYRQAKAGHAVRSGGTARFVN